MDKSISLCTCTCPVQGISQHTKHGWPLTRPPTCATGWMVWAGRWMSTISSRHKFARSQHPTGCHLKEPQAISAGRESCHSRPSLWMTHCKEKRKIAAQKPSSKAPGPVFPCLGSKGWLLTKREAHYAEGHQASAPTFWGILRCTAACSWLWLLWRRRLLLPLHLAKNLQALSGQPAANGLLQS